MISKGYLEEQEDADDAPEKILRSCICISRVHPPIPKRLSVYEHREMSGVVDTCPQSHE